MVDYFSKVSFNLKKVEAQKKPSTTSIDIVEGKHQKHKELVRLSAKIRCEEC